MKSLSVGDLSVELLPPDPDPSGKAPAETLIIDPLSDPETYGRSGVVPGFSREDLGE